MSGNSKTEAYSVRSGDRSERNGRLVSAPLKPTPALALLAAVRITPGIGVGSSATAVPAVAVAGLVVVAAVEAAEAALDGLGLVVRLARGLPTARLGGG